MSRPKASHGKGRKRNLFENGLPDPGAAKQCYGKRAMNKQQAIQMVVRLVKNGYSSPDTLVYYKCRICKRYHIGNDPNRMQQR